MRPSWLVRVCLLSALVVSATAADVSGKWAGTSAPIDDNGNPGQPDSVYLVLKQNGTALTGTGGPTQYQQWPIENGKIDGNKIAAEVTSTDGTFYVMVATVDGDHITGGVKITENGESRKAVIDLKRLP